MSLVCEARVPTYRRPVLLRRALESLRAQTHPDWRAVVLDDSPDREGDAVVRAIGDERIAYRPNSQRLGAAANIDQAFTSSALAGGDFAFVLEDDAAIHPDCLRENLRALETSGASLLLRNQAIHSGDEWRATGATTRGDWIEPGERSPLEIHALLFFMEGISNGGLFWRLGGGGDLVVGASVTDAGLQEHCRTLLVRQPLIFAPEPLAIFTELPAGQIQRSVTGNRVFARGAQAIRRHLLARHGPAIVDAARVIAERTGRTAALAQSLCDAGTLPRSLCPSSLKAFAKGAARRALVADPLAEFLHRIRP